MNKCDICGRVQKLKNIDALKQTVDDKLKKRALI